MTWAHINWIFLMLDGSCEMLSLWKILCEHQFHVIAASLPQEQQTALLAASFRYNQHSLNYRIELSTTFLFFNSFRAGFLNCQRFMKKKAEIHDPQRGRNIRKVEKPCFKV